MWETTAPLSDAMTIRLVIRLARMAAIVVVFEVIAAMPTGALASAGLLPGWLTDLLVVIAAFVGFAAAMILLAGLIGNRKGFNDRQTCDSAPSRARWFRGIRFGIDPRLHLRRSPEAQVIRK